MLYRSTDRLCRCGAPVQYLSHSASFHSREKYAPPNAGTKHLDQIAGKFRTRLGESLATVEKYDTPLAEATTPSLEALKAYSLGQKKMSEGRKSAALSFFQRAVELDPNFAA